MQEFFDHFGHFIETYYEKNEIIEFKKFKKEIAGMMIGSIPETFPNIKSKTNLCWNRNKLILNEKIWINF